MSEIESPGSPCRALVFRVRRCVGQVCCYIPVIVTAPTPPPPTIPTTMTTKPPTPKPTTAPTPAPCVCVPYPVCNPGYLYPGTGVIDPRQQLGYCGSFGQVCCSSVAPITPICGCQPFGQCNPGYGVIDPRFQQLNSCGATGTMCCNMNAARTLSGGTWDCSSQDEEICWGLVTGTIPFLGLLDYYKNFCLRISFYYSSHYCHIMLTMNLYKKSFASSVENFFRPQCSFIFLY